MANCAGSAAPRFDTAILLQNAFEAAALVWLAGIPRRIGYARDGRGFLLTDCGPCSEEGEIPPHRALLLSRTAPPAPGSSIRFRSPTQIRLGGATAAREAGRQRFEAAGLDDVTGVSPGAAFGDGEALAARAIRRGGGELGSPVGAFWLEGRAGVVRERSRDAVRTRAVSRS